MEQYKKLLQSIDIISQLDSMDFVMLAGPDGRAQPQVERLTEKAALVSFDTGGGDLVKGWLPLSQLRCDKDGNLYLIEWLFRQRAANV